EVLAGRRRKPAAVELVRTGARLAFGGLTAPWQKAVEQIRHWLLPARLVTGLLRPGRRGLRPHVLGLDGSGLGRGYGRRSGACHAADRAVLVMVALAADQQLALLVDIDAGRHRTVGEAHGELRAALVDEHAVLTAALAGID